MFQRFGSPLLPAGEGPGDVNTASSSFSVCGTAAWVDVHARVGRFMNKYNCTCNTEGYLWRAVCIARSEDAAREMAANYADRKWWGYGLAELNAWRVALTEMCVPGPARVEDSTYFTN